jgi:hypothetical protein
LSNIRTFRSRLALAAAGATIVAVALSGCSVIPTFVNRVRDGLAGQSAPRVGECWTQTYNELQEWETWQGSAPVSCARPHEAYTYAVTSVSRSLPANRDDSSGNVIDSVNNAAWDACQVQMHRYWPTLGDSDVLFQPAFYLPSLSSWRSGARGVRCDIAVIKVGSSVAKPALRALPSDIGTLRTALTTAPDQFKYCIDTPGGASSDDPAGKGATYADCTRSPDWLLIKEITIPGGEDAAYPGESSIDAQISTDCTDRYSADHGGTFAYYPSKDSWNQDGDRLIDCWVTAE